jgi:hypothetical protein
MKAKILAAVLAFASQGAFAGAIINGDFDAGLSGWTTFGNVSVVNVGGDNVAQLMAGVSDNVYTTLSQTVHLDAGDVLTGNAIFYAIDALPFNDDAFVSINGSNLFYASVATVGDYGNSGWVGFSYTAATSGNYVLTAGVANHPDNAMSSALQVDDFTVRSVPEPASVGLLGLGLLGLAGARRKRRA